MKIIRHRSHGHIIDPATEILIVGTFNPDTPGNPADFFYGRSRNFLWRLLPAAFGLGDLKGRPREEKIAFIRNMKIDLIDLIAEVTVDEGEEANYEDIYLDSRVSEWRDVLAEIGKLNKLKKVCFTRKTFSGIPMMKKRIEQVRDHCEERNILFRCLTTPSRLYHEKKQQEWTSFLKE